MSKIQSPDAEQVEALLRGRFKNVKAYRYNSASIRIRIIDARFHGKSPLKREAMVDSLIRQLPDEVQSDITFLLLLAPEERKTSALNIGFEKPGPSRL